MVFCMLFFTCTERKEEEADHIIPYPPSLPIICRTQNETSGTEVFYDDYDEYFKHQWYLNHDSHFSINIIPAWEITKGAGIKVAVLDVGIDKYHEDFSNIEVYNVSDGTDVCHSIISKGFSHGTTVSGIIAARKNAVGTMGIAHECDFLFVGDTTTKVVDKGNVAEDLYSSDAIVIKAFQYAKDWGARVISCSWGTYNASSTLRSQMKNLYESGVVVLFASGNENKSLDLPGINDESEIAEVIGVSASDETGSRVNFSNYGRNIDIMAPGINIFSLDTTGTEGSYGGQKFQNYRAHQGTSFATPIAAGVVALMLAVNPSLTPKEVRTIITETAQKTCGITNETYDGNGFSLSHAYGLIDAAKAVRRAAGLKDDDNGNSAISE